MRCDFRTFEVGDSNVMANTMCKNFCESPRCYSGLWLFGPSGCGKTHLLKATIKELRYAEEYLNGLYISAKELAEILYDFIGGGSNLWVRIKTYDYLVIDNLEDLQGKPKTQTMIADLIMDLQVNNKLVFLASTCSPDNLQNLTPVLKLHDCDIPIIEILSPDYNLKKSIVEKFMAKHSFTILDEVLELLITSYDHIPRLRGALFAAKHLFETQGVCVDIDWFKRHGYWI